jgi:hypothetical protein
MGSSFVKKGFAANSFPVRWQRLRGKRLHFASDPCAIAGCDSKA